jgi:hypothetical protein
MKQSPEEQKIRERMGAGVLSRNGFLGSDGRSPGEILDADHSAVVGLGTSHEALSEVLGRAIGAAMRAMGRPVKVGEHLTAVYQEAMGRIPCPWGDGEIFPKGEVRVTDDRTGESILLTPLSVHLIGEHGFYQGRGCRYRIEPEQIVRMFGLPAAEGEQG